MKKKAQIVRLENLDTNKIIEVLVVQHDSIQGYWGEELQNHLSIQRDWEWYNPKEWSEIG